MIEVKVIQREFFIPNIKSVFDSIETLLGQRQRLAEFKDWTFSSCSYVLNSDEFIRSCFSINSIFLDEFFPVCAFCSQAFQLNLLYQLPHKT